MLKTLLTTRRQTMLRKQFNMHCINIHCIFVFVLLTVLTVTANAETPKTIPTLGRFEEAVRNYSYRSLDNPPIPGCSLFVGSSSFAIWGKKLEATFAEYDAVNRGFGGSNYAQNIIALERIHLPYRPARVVIFCGTNDIAGGTNVETVFSNFKYYIARHWNANPLTEIYFVSTTHAPVREKFWQQGDEFCAKVQELASQTKGLFYIDVITPMNGDDGKVRENLFVKDRLHLNDEGYAIWTEAFKKVFEAQNQNRTKLDIRELFQNRKKLGLFDDSRFAKDGVIVQEPPATDTKLNIVFIGDSITIGGGEKSPPARCAEYLKQQAGIRDVAFSNQGVSGLTTVDFLPSKNKQFPKVVEAANLFKKDQSGKLLFSVMLGANDSAVTGPNGSPVSPENYRRNLKEIVDRLLKDYPDSQIVLHRPIWYSETTQNSSTYLLEGQLRVTVYGQEIQSLVDFYSRTPDRMRVVLGDTQAYSYFKTHHESAMRHETGKNGTFFLHPNDRGAEVLGRFWGAAIANHLP
ncbi:MAG: GDSL-type esterase/lipase family protein [Planctomycetaceae bacterium]|jgi:lysophospholipase L1-like esterase|nr:GDSL-type esterase/lipase family protein [Planctomycetaceae bacterium]